MWYTLSLIAIIGLSASRLTTLIIYDEIFEPIRHRLFLLSPPEDNDNYGRDYQCWHRTRDINGSRMPQRKGPFRTRYMYSYIQRETGFFGKLFSCPDCLGVWVAAASYLSVTYIDIRFIYVHSIFAIAMIVSLLARKYE